MGSASSTYDQRYHYPRSNAYYYFLYLHVTNLSGLEKVAIQLRDTKVVLYNFREDPYNYLRRFSSFMFITEKIVPSLEATIVLDGKESIIDLVHSKQAAGENFKVSYCYVSTKDMDVAETYLMLSSMHPRALGAFVKTIDIGRSPFFKEPCSTKEELVDAILSTLMSYAIVPPPTNVSEATVADVLNFLNGMSQLDTFELQLICLYPPGHLQVALPGYLMKRCFRKLRPRILEELRAALIKYRGDDEEIVAAVTNFMFVVDIRDTLLKNCKTRDEIVDILERSGATEAVAEFCVAHDNFDKCIFRARLLADSYPVRETSTHSEYRAWLRETAKHIPTN